jgi:hypothetical protein
VLADPDTLHTTFVPLPDLGKENAQGLGLAWTPDGTSIALTTSRTDGVSQTVVTGIRIYDLTGRLLRTVPATASLVDSAGFSPDGRRMALTDREATGSPTVFTIAEFATGGADQVRSVRLDRPAQLVGWADDAHLLVWVFGDSAPPKAARRDQLLIVNLGGQTVRAMDPPTDQPQQVFIGSSDGLPASAKALTF